MILDPKEKGGLGVNTNFNMILTFLNNWNKGLI